MFFRRRALLFAFKSFDLMVMVFSLAMATAADISQHHVVTVSFARIFSIWVEPDKLAFLLTFAFAWHIIFSLLGLYRSKRFISRWSEFVDIIKATLLGTLTMLGLTLLLRVDTFTPLFMTFFWIASTAISLLGRLVMRYTLAHLRIHGRNLRFILIVGTNQRAIEFAQRIESRKELGYRIIGFVDADWSGIRNLQETRYALLGGFNDFSTIIRKNVVDEVMLCLPIKSLYSQALQIIRFCEEQGIIVRLLPDIFDLRLSRSNIEEFEGESMIKLFTGSMEGWPVLVKRILDISGSLVLLIVLMPLFLVTAVLIKATSQGPVLFVQDRVGLNKRRFRLYKFRTMFQDAEKTMEELEPLNEVSGPVFKIKDDPRITSTGKLLRKASIDELPQLLNVLKGDMSLVGPRPLPERDYEGFDKDWHRRRFSVRPGITCLWQVNGRHAINFEQWMELDMLYIDQWSLWLDLKILFMTVPAVLRGTGAT